MACGDAQLTHDRGGLVVAVLSGSDDNCCMNEEQKTPQLRQRFDELPFPRVSWETFKRLHERNRGDILTTIHQAIRIARKEQI